MTEISETAKAKAEELMRHQMGREHDAFARFIQQVSDAAITDRERQLDLVKELGRVPHQLDAPAIRAFILPEPVDPLMQAFQEWSDEDPNWTGTKNEAEKFKRILTKLGLKIVNADA